tara:strand:- start:407 stop:1078 length:672 start_codon:yes stop_codon:yes gene_type:complete
MTLYKIMANFSLFETFFFITLAITFILILLLVYHFKDRLTKLEQKSDSMFEIIQNLSGTFSEEISRIKSGGNGNGNVILSPTMNPYVVPNDENDLIEADFDVRKIENINLALQENNEDDIDDEEYSDSDSDENEDESNSDEGSDNEEENSEVEDNDQQLNEIDLKSEDETTIEKIDIPHMVENDNIDYKKMNVSQLRELVTSKGLSNTVGKLKKNELIDLLSQ